MKPYLFLLALLQITWAAPTYAADFVWLVHDRPPYRVWNEDGSVGGLFVEQAKKAFDEADISYEFRPSTANRTQALLKQNSEPVCSTGWFRTAEREAYALYSEPFFRGNGTGALVRKDHDEALWHKTFDSLLSDETMQVGYRRGWSYGKFFDDMLEHHGTEKVIHNQTNAGSIAMLMAVRFDYLLVSVDTVDYLLSSVEGAKDQLRLMTMEDAPPGDLRYILCSKQVGSEFMEKLNAAIQRLELVSVQ